MRSQASKFGGVGLVMLLGAASAVFACSSGGDDDERPSAGSNSGGNAGSSTGGSNGGASAGTSPGGSGGAGGAPMSFACPGIKPTSTDITDFTDLMPEAEPMWGATPAMDAFYGGLFAYGGKDAIPVTDVSKNDLHITGKVSDYSGAGLYVAYCTDASKYQGVRFKIKGDAGPSKKVAFAVQTNRNLYPDEMAMKGVCQAAEDKKFIDCDHPRYSVSVSDTASEIEVTWDKLAGGKPASAATTTGTDIVGFSWIFTWATGTTPYDVDITIDDVAFIGEDSGAGGSGAGGDTGAGGDPGAGGGK